MVKKENKKSARFCPELNKQVQSLDFTLFPMRRGIKKLALLKLYEH